MNWGLLWKTYHKIAGDTSIGSEIFKYESILELRTVARLRKMGYYTSNVYDCFYSEAPVDVIKGILNHEAKILVGNNFKK